MLIAKKDLNKVGESLEVWCVDGKWKVVKFRAGREMYYYVMDNGTEAMNKFNSMN